jgi:hypothetical protein
VLTAGSDVFGDGFEHHFGTTAEAVKTRECKQDAHDLAVFDPHTGAAEQLAARVQ